MKHISHYTAAVIWDIPFLELALGTYGKKRAAEPHLQDISLSSLNKRTNRKNWIVHHCSSNLPNGAVTKRNAQIVSSPELLFIELAAVLEIHQLILLGLLLTSHPAGKPSATLTTKEKMQNLIACLPKFKGRPKAMLAIKHIEGGAASVMEALAFMTLTLPHTLGGYGLVGAIFNHEITLNKEAARKLKKKKCFADIYYHEEKLAVEYDSFAHHSTPAEQAKDMLRESALEHQGITVMRFGTVQLYDKEACGLLASNLAHRLGRRVRIRNKRFDSNHQLLRTLLPVAIKQESFS